MKRLREIRKNKFGSEMIIVKVYGKGGKVDIYFPEYSYLLKNAQYGNFKAGTLKCPYEPRTQGVGYIGVGEYSSYDEHGEPTKAYGIWSGILQRCYGNAQRSKKYNTYEGCTVCTEWHNFQNFAKWYEENYYEVEGQQMCVDKDLLYQGNKVYSPLTCVIVPHIINTITLNRKNDRGNLPIGVCYDKKKNKYKAQCSDTKRRSIHVGYFDTIEEAFQSYKKFKEKIIKEVADEYKDVIPLKLYNALYEYKVEIND